MEAHSGPLSAPLVDLAAPRALARPRARRWRRPDLRALALPALLVVGWELLARSSWVNPVIAPSLATVARTALELGASGDLWLSAWATLQRILLGAAIAGVLGVGVGVACALSRWCERLVGTPLAAIRQVPLFGWIPLIAVLAGIGEGAKIAFVVLAAFHPVALNTVQAIRGAPAELVEVARMLRFSRWQLLRRVLLPAAMPGILTGLKHGLTFAGVAVVAAEVFMTAAPGLGNLLDHGQTTMRADIVLVGVAAIGVVGITLNLLIDRLSARLLRWRAAHR